MDLKKKRRSPLAEAEMAALEAGREWTRQKLQKDLQLQADELGEFSPLERFSPGPASSKPDRGADDGGVR